MPIYFIHWTEEIIQHLADNDVSPEDFETVVMDGRSRAVTSRASGRPARIGVTDDGRVLFCFRLARRSSNGNRTSDGFCYRTLNAASGARLMMLKRGELPKMTAEEKQDFLAAVAQEQAGTAENVAAARPIARELLEECRDAVAVVAMLRQARQQAGVSLAELETRTGIQKSALSRLENSRAPNPTLATLQRYAQAVGKRLRIEID